MNVKLFKFIFFIYLFFFNLSFINSQSLSSKYVIETEYFDIIYDIPSEHTAMILSEKIDSIYLNLLERLKISDIDYFKHFPIYIEWTTQEFNAYYSRFPFEYIVYYDTPPRDSLLVFEDTLSSVIEHELVHAITSNMASKPLSLVGLSATLYSAPSSILEGIAVQKESENGQGRLNSSFSTHILKQSIIEDKFPSYKDITGARDIYPTGELPYIFGGAFTDFVIKKYGPEKYEKFIKTLNDKLLNYHYVYKKNYLNTIESDWLEFKDSIKVPDVQKDLYKVDGVFDYFKLENKKFSQNKIYQYSNPTSFSNGNITGTAWITKNNNQVWFLKKDKGSNKNYKPKKLFTMNGISKINFSSDGRFLVVSRTQFFSKYKTNVLIFDMEEGNFIKFPGNGYRDGVVIQKDNKYFFSLVKTLSQNSVVEIYSFDYQKKDSEKFTKIDELKFDYGDVILDLNDLGDFQLSFIINSKNKKKISIYNLISKKIILCPLPEDVEIRNLSGFCSKNFITKQEGFLLIFSYAKENTFPRLGFLSLKKQNDESFSCNYHLSVNDFSGGVYSPVLYNSSESKSFPSVIYVSQFYDNSKLSVLNPDYFEFETIKADYSQVDIGKNPNYFNSSNNTSYSLDENQRDKYNPFTLFYKGFIIPIGLSPICNDDFEPVSYAFIGATWVSKFLNFSIGFEPFTNCYGTSLTMLNNSESGNLNVKSVISSIFNEFNFLQSSTDFDFSLSIPMQKYSYLLIQNKSNLFYGKPLDNFIQLEKKQTNSFINTTTFLGSTTIRKVGGSIHEIGGHQIGMIGNYYYIKDLKTKNYLQGFNLGLSTVFAIPHILPFQTQNSVTYNLPTILQINLFPNILQFANFSTSLILFSTEIQKGISFPLIPMYLNRFYITASYSGEFHYSDYLNFAIFNPKLKDNLTQLKYQDYIDLKIALDFTINTGQLQKLGAISLYCDLMFYLRQIEQGNRFCIKFGSQLVF